MDQQTRQFTGSTPIIAGFVLLMLGLVSAPAESQTRADSRSVSFDGQTLVFASRSQNAGESVREFIPAGERLESWTRLASIREYPALDDPKAVVANLVRVLKQQNPQAPRSVLALRDYEDPREFLRRLKPLRGRLVRLMAEDGLTPVR